LCLQKPKKDCTFAPQYGSETGCFTPGLKGNAVKVGASSRCCKFRCFTALLPLAPRPGRRRWRNKSEDLPLLQTIFTLSCGEKGG